MRGTRNFAVVALVSALVHSTIAAGATSGGAPGEDAPKRADLAGAWCTEGIPSGESIYMMLVFEQAAEQWTITAIVPQAIILDKPLQDVQVEKGRRFSGSRTSAAAELTFSGGLNIDTGRIEGTIDVDRGGKKDALPFTLVPTVRVAKVEGARRYATDLKVMGMTLPIGMSLADAGAMGWVGAIDIPAQSLKQFPVIVSRAGDSFEITIPVGGPAVMKLTELQDGATLEGTFAQGEVDVPVVFARTDEPVKGSRRPQEPVPPLPYGEREVLVPCPGGHSLAGTLTIPPGASADHAVPGVVMLTGSGLQDRDESLMGHRPFLVIADALTRAGIAVLRCDDRGLGGSTGDPAKATSSDFADDGRAMMAFLRAQPEIDAARCGYLGHSEGGLTGPMAALRDQESGTPVAFAVLLAGPAVSGAKILPLQMRRLLAAIGTREELIAEIVENQTALLEAVQEGASREVIVPHLIALIEVQQRGLAERTGGDAPAPLSAESAEVLGALGQFESPWMQMFLAYDPAPALRDLKAPILAMNGDLDTQVDTEQNLVLIESIRNEAGLPVTTKRYKSLNHLFQPAVTGSIEEYGLIETTIDPQVLDDLVKWVQETTASASR